MDVYPPHHMLPQDSLRHTASFAETIEGMDLSDDVLVEYIKTYFSAFRHVVEKFFPQIANSLPLYALHPFHTTAIRLGPNGVIIGHRRNSEQRIEVKRYQDFDPPFASPNLFDIVARLEFEICGFDCTVRRYDQHEAQAHAFQDALSGVLNVFWPSIPDEATFEQICIKMLAAEGIEVKQRREEDEDTVDAMDASAAVILHEPAGFRRIEQWGFEFKYYQQQRLSADLLRKTEAALSTRTLPEVLCLLTSDDLTTVGRYVASENPRIRVWDRTILNLLVNRHPEVIRDYIAEYPKAIQELTGRLAAAVTSAAQASSEQVRNKLAGCPVGQQHFAEYEAIGIELLLYLFPNDLGTPSPQSRTLDGKQRRDFLCRNNRASRFFDRIFHRYDADSVIVDFKNYADEIDASIVFDVDKYANKALGRFILVVCRKGAKPTVEAAQHRVFRDSSTIVLVVSDTDLIEMVERTKRQQSPNDVLEDKLDELLRSY